MATHRPSPKHSWLATVVRCLPAVVILVAGFIVLATVQFTDFSFSSMPTNDIMWILGITELAIYVWIRVFARIPFPRQVMALVLLVASQLGLYSTLRIDGFMGDGRPIVAWRWEPTSVPTWSGAAAPTPSASRADLAATTPWDYPAFRGSERAGIAPRVPYVRQWNHPPRKLWRQEVGLGWSSFAVVGDYCVTQEQRDHQESVVCRSLHSGRQIWQHSDTTCFDEVTSGKGPRATPTIHNGRVYALGATGILNCLDGSTGRALWSTNILKDSKAKNALFGMAGSPLVVDGLVIVGPGGESGSLVAYDAQTGRRTWSGGSAPASYSSPQLAPFQVGTQLLSFNALGLSGHEFATGTELWTVPWVSNPSERNNVCQPVVISSDGTHSDQVFISSGYGKGCALFDIERDENGYHVRQRWQNLNLKAKFSSVVHRDGYIYGLDERILTCVELATGKRRWKGGRYGYGQLVLADEVLVVQAESGDVAVVQATPDGFDEVSRLEALGHRTWNHPVVAGDILLVRNNREAACFQIAVQDDR